MFLSYLLTLVNSNYALFNIELLPMIGDSRSIPLFMLFLAADPFKSICCDPGDGLGSIGASAL
jgi:hypothetical protein